MSKNVLGFFKENGTHATELGYDSEFEDCWIIHEDKLVPVVLLAKHQNQKNQED